LSRPLQTVFLMIVFRRLAAQGDKLPSGKAR
jgi:hypothetical protein